MTEQGFIKLHRSILGWEWWSDANTTRVFLWLLLNAQWEDSRFRGYEVPRGSLVTSYAKISEALEISVQSARTSLNHLKSTGEITIKSTNKFTVVSIVNWEKFQCFDDSGNKQINNQPNKQLTNNQQTTNNIKEIKKVINKEDNITGFDLYRKTKKGNYDFEALERETRNGRS